MDPENSAVPAAAVHGLLSAANHSMINDNHYWMNDITYTGTYTNGTPAAFRVWSQSQLDFMYLDPDFPALSFPSDYDSDSYVNTGIRTEFAIGGHGRKRKRQSHSPPPRLVRFRNIHHQTGLCRVVDRGAAGNCYPFVVQAHIAAARARGEGTPTTDEIRAAGVDQIRRWVNGAVAMDVTTELMLKELLSATSADFNAWCKRVRCGSLSVSLSFSLQLLFPLLLFSALSHSAQLTHSHTPAAFFSSAQMLKDHEYADENLMEGIAYAYDLDVRILHDEAGVLVPTESAFGRRGAVVVYVEFTGSCHDGHCRHCMPLTALQVQELRRGALRGPAEGGDAQSSAQGGGAASAANDCGLSQEDAVALQSQSCGTVWCDCPLLQHRPGPLGLNCVVRTHPDLIPFEQLCPHLAAVLDGPMVACLASHPTYTDKAFRRFIEVCGQEVLGETDSNRTPSEEVNATLTVLTRTQSWVTWMDAMMPKTDNCTGSRSTTTNNHHWQVRSPSPPPPPPPSPSPSPSPSHSHSHSFSFFLFLLPSFFFFCLLLVLFSFFFSSPSPSPSFSFFFFLFSPSPSPSPPHPHPPSPPHVADPLCCSTP